jgi:hypothetical protein
MAQIVEPAKFEALSSNPSTIRKEKKKKMYNTAPNKTDHACKSSMRLCSCLSVPHSALHATLLGTWSPVYDRDVPSWYSCSLVLTSLIPTKSLPAPQGWTTDLCVLTAPLHLCELSQLGTQMCHIEPAQLLP